MRNILNSKFTRKTIRFISNSLFYPVGDILRIISYEFRRRFKDVPLSISIETTTICNLKCSYCPSEKISEQRSVYMKENIFEEIISGIEESFPGYKGQILPHLYGEPLSDKRIFNLTELTRKILPDSEIVFFSNGELLSRDNYDLLKEKGVNRFVITQHKNSIPARMKNWFRKEDHADIRYQIAGKELTLYNRGGSVQIENTAKLKFCHYAPYGMTFNTEGDLIACCNDPFSTKIFGNISEGLGNLWNNPEYKKFRTQVRKGKMILKICRSCTGK